ncbi:MAG: ATP-binding cassette domain-containing protein [Oligoflexales bacterium]|nr:ATP-binding cassette domain-containing protein [Oligoflexales bacterium]
MGRTFIWSYLKVNQLHFSLRRRFALSVNKFEVSPGSRTLIQGPSGSGKTTFLMLLRGILLPSSGSICVLGKELCRLTDRERRFMRLTQVGSIFQQPTLLPYLRVIDNLKLNRLLGHRDFPDPTKHPLIDELGVRPILNRYPSELSGGEVQRVCLIRPFLHNPQIVIADEPTNHLDKEHRKCFVELLQDFQTTENMALIVSHDDQLIPICDNVINFQDLMQ